MTCEKQFSNSIDAGLVISTMVMFFMDTLSVAASGFLLGRREAVWTIQEQLQRRLSQASFNKDNRDSGPALSFVNRVLEKGPDFADALFLKAPILWEGFGQAYAIKIQKVEKSVQTMTAELCRINDKLIQKK